MAQKVCFKCENLKPLGDFYKHPQMADGHFNKCKECNKKDVTENRNAKIIYYREYYKERGSRQSALEVREYRNKNPEKYFAHKVVRLGVKSGILIRKNCEQCGSSSKTHAHHDNYAKPLDVRWLCPACHKKWHKENGEAPYVRQ